MYWLLIAIAGLMLLVTIILLLQVGIAKWVARNNRKENK
jgi:hypothetical protein